jgi:hypothetical protein
MKKQNTITIIRTCKEEGTQKQVSLEYAVRLLNNYCINIQNSLIQGKELFTPYANYQIKK